MKRVTVELLLTDAQVEAARLQSTKIGGAGMFDAKGLLGSGLVNLLPDMITIKAVAPVNGMYGVETWEHFGAPDKRVAWYDTPLERERGAEEALRKFRLVRYVNHTGGTS